MNKENILKWIEKNGTTITGSYYLGEEIDETYTLVITHKLRDFLNAQESENKYQIVTEVYKEYAEQMAKEYDSAPYPQPFQNWLAKKEDE